MDFRGNNPGYYTPDSNSIMAGTGLASGQQGSFRRKPNTLPLNKRLNAPYKEQVIVGSGYISQLQMLSVVRNKVCI